MSNLIYYIDGQNRLIWNQHDGWLDGSVRWAQPENRQVGTGWDFKHVFRASIMVATIPDTPAPPRPVPNTPVPLPPSAPTINVELTLIPGSFNQLRVFGGLFSARERVTISVTTLVSGQDPSTLPTPTTANSLGKIDQTISVTCVPGATIFQAQARGESSGKISNTPRASC